MRAITVRQPWAWAIVHAGKDVENRTRNIAGSYRGPLAIHAGLSTASVEEAMYDPRVRTPYSELVDQGRRPDLRYGAILGVVDLVDAHPADYLPDPGGDPAAYTPCSPWAQYPNWLLDPMWHLALKNPRALAEPMPYRGRLGLWTLPDDVAATVTDRTTKGKN